MKIYILTYVKGEAVIVEAIVLRETEDYLNTDKGRYLKSAKGKVWFLDWDSAMKAYDKGLHYD